MSRSTRRPYAAVTGVRSARIDKKMAGRGMRRKQNQWLNNHWNDEDFGLLPHRLECNHNDTYGWGRDGSQYYHELSGRARHRYYLVSQGLSPWSWMYGRPASEHDIENYGVWPPLWYRQLLRK